MGLEYVDIFYSHRYDPDTPLEETMGGLAHAVHTGKALYAGVSNYPPEATREAIELLDEMGAPLLIHQPKYSMLVRDPEDVLFGVLADEGVGSIAYSPLAQGLLTDKYLDGIPTDSRAAKATGFLREDQVTDDVVETVRQLREIARDRGQSMAQLALAWTRRRPEVTSTLIGASRVEQIEEAVAMLSQPPLANDEVEAIDAILG
jgi:L-glyceraldehyde 3-phosphate reductase